MTVSEGRAVWASGKTATVGPCWVEMKQILGQYVAIAVDGFAAHLTPEEARKLADDMYHLADGLERTTE